MGNDENKPLKGVFSSNCARVWKEFTTQYYSVVKIPPRSFKKPSKLVTKKIDPLTGLLANPDTPNAVEKQFFPGTEPKKYAPATKVNKASAPKLDLSKPVYNLCLINLHLQL